MVRCLWWADAAVVTEGREDFDGLCSCLIHPFREVGVVDAVPLSSPDFVADVECYFLDGEGLT